MVSWFRPKGRGGCLSVEIQLLLTYIASKGIYFGHLSLSKRIYLNLVYRVIQILPSVSQFLAKNPKLPMPEKEFC